MKYILKSASIIGIVLMIVSCSSSKTTKTNTNFNNVLIGTWQICNSEGVVDNNLYGRTDETSYKIFSSEKFSVFSLHLVNRKVIKSFLGSYTADSKTITEYVEYRSNGYPRISNQKYTYNYKIENGLLFIEGIDNLFKEVWKKIE